MSPVAGAAAPPCPGKTPPSLDGTPFPLRFTPRIVRQAEVEVRNREEGRKGSSRFLEAARAMKMAAAAQSAVPERIESWLHHPDERVQIAFAENTGGLFDDLRSQMLFRTSFARVLREGELWSPVLEALLLAGGRGKHSNGAFAARSLAEKLAQGVVGEWIGAQSEPESFAPLLVPGRASCWRDAVARHARCLSDSMVREFAKAGQELPIAHNPHLTPAQVEMVWDRLIALSPTYVRGVNAAVQALEESGFLPTERQRKRMRSLEAMRKLFFNDQNARASAERRCRDFLVAQRTLPHADLLRVAEVATAEEVMALNDHPGADWQVKRVLAGRALRNQEWLAKRWAEDAAARQVPEVRDYLMGCPVTLLSLAEDSSPEEFARIFRQLLRWDRFADATALLEGASEERRRALAEEHCMIAEDAVRYGSGRGAERREPLEALVRLHFDAGLRARWSAVLQQDEEEVNLSLTTAASGERLSYGYFVRRYGNMEERRALAFSEEGTEFAETFRQLAHSASLGYLAEVMESARPEQTGSLSKRDWVVVADALLYGERNRSYSDREGLRASEILSHIPEALAEPRLRDEVIRVGSYEVRLRVLWSLEGACARELFLRIAEENASSLMQAMTRADWDNVCGALDKADLLPLLQHEKPQVREGAMRVVSRVALLEKQRGQP